MDTLFEEEFINLLTSFLHDPDEKTKYLATKSLRNYFQSNDKQDPQLFRKIIKALTQLFETSDLELRDSAFTEITRLTFSDGITTKVVISHGNGLTEQSDHFLQRDVIDILTPFFQHSMPVISETALEILQITFSNFFKHPDYFTDYLTHSSKNIRDAAAAFLIEPVEQYLQNFQTLDQFFQLPSSDLTVELILKKFSIPESFRPRMEVHLESGNFEELKLVLASSINRIEALKGPQIIQLALVIIGQEKVMKDGSDRQKLIELAKEVLTIQLKYLTEEGLVWIKNNYDKLLSLSPESKIFYKKIFHKLIEDGQISPLEEELIIKFINQGLTASLTRDGEIVFEGKRYRLQGDDIELALEKIAKTVIDQQQDILARQYKDHEPIFRKVCKRGMREAAADKKEVKSIVDSRQALKNDVWLLTKLKSLKFNSEIVLLEQRSAFGDHVIYHLKQHRLFRFYPDQPPALEGIFGSYIYGEVYQGEVTELTYEVGQKLLESQDIIKPNVEGKLCSKQVYFQQELFKQGSEDRNSAIEEELAKKLDNNRTVLEAKLKSLSLQETEKIKIQDYYEGFVSTFSSVYTSSLAVDSGKLSIDDGEDFFSPVNIFIQLTSLAPFGIGEILSNGLEAARSYIKSNEIKNEARFVKDIAIDAVDLSDIVSKTALNIISTQEQRKKILEAKDDDDQEQTRLIDKIQNLVNEKLEKLKNMAEKYSKMKNLFEKEIQTSPAFRLGESDANKIIKEWIDLKASQPDLRMKPQEKQRKFVKTVVGSSEEIGEGNKISPMQVTPEGDKKMDKSACCEIF